MKVLALAQPSRTALLGVLFALDTIRLACAVRFSETKVEPGIVADVVALQWQMTLSGSPSESWEPILKP